MCIPKKFSIANIHLLLLPGVGKLEFHLRLSLFLVINLCGFLWSIKPAEESTDYFVLRRRADLLI